MSLDLTKLSSYQLIKWIEGNLDPSTACPHPIHPELKRRIQPLIAKYEWPTVIDLHGFGVVINTRCKTYPTGRSINSDQYYFPLWALDDNGKWFKLEAERIAIIHKAW